MECNIPDWDWVECSNQEIERGRPVRGFLYTFPHLAVVTLKSEWLRGNRAHRLQFLFSSVQVVFLYDPVISEIPHRPTLRGNKITCRLTILPSPFMDAMAASDQGCVCVCVTHP